MIGFRFNVKDACKRGVNGRDSEEGGLEEGKTETSDDKWTEWTFPCSTSAGEP